MPVDPSIILGVRPPQFDNQIDQQAKAQQVQSMGIQAQMQQRAMADDQATRQAYSQAMTAGPNGPTLDRQKLLSGLPPMLAYKAQQELAANDSAQAKSQLEVTKAQREQHAGELGQVIALPPEQKQAAWSALRQKNIAAGLPGAANTPEQFPGDQFLYQGMTALMGPKDQVEYKMKGEENKLKHEDIAIKREQLGADKENKMAQDLDKHLSQGWAGRSGQAGQVQGKINSAQAAEQLIEQGKSQPGGLDSRQIEELAQSTAKLLGGGPSASARIEALVPHTLMGRAQSLQEYLTNNPTGQNQQAFVQRMAETVAREKALATNQMQQFQVEGLAAHQGLRNRNPNLYNSILQQKGIDPSMIDANGRYKAPSAGPSPFHQMSDDELDKAYRAAGGK